MASQKIQDLDTKASVSSTDWLAIAGSNYLEATITGITQANPAVVTAAAHGFSNGNEIYVDGALGMTSVNGNTYTVAGATTNTFQLSGVNSTGYSAYTSGGTAVRGRLQKASVSSVGSTMTLQNTSDIIALDGRLDTAEASIIAQASTISVIAAEDDFSGITTTATIDANTTHRVKCGGTGSYTVTISAATASNDWCQFINTGSAVVTLDPASTAQIYEAPGGAVNTFALYPGESVFLQWDSAYWVVCSRFKVPHRAEMTRTTAQSIPNGSVTAIDFNNGSPNFSPIGITFDGSQAQELLIARTGFYHYDASWGLNGFTSASILAVLLNVSGAGVRQQNLPANSVVCSQTGLIWLTAGQRVGVSVLQGTGSAQNTETGNTLPRLSLVEV